jgi:hypothetical protein
MSGPAGIDAAVALLRLLPVELVRRILALLPPLDAARLQTALERAPETLAPEAEISALKLFFQTRRSLALSDRASTAPPESANNAQTPATTPATNDGSRPAASSETKEPSLRRKSMIRAPCSNNFGRWMLLYWRVPWRKNSRRP